MELSMPGNTEAIIILPEFMDSLKVSAQNDHDLKLGGLFLL